MDKSQYNPNNDYLGLFHPLDGTIEFYSRIRSVLEAQHCIIDLGAGRGAWFYDDSSLFRRNMRNLKNDAAFLIGIDTDPAVLNNPTTTLNLLIKNSQFPLLDASADIVIADYVLEHVENPALFSSEINRILKPGGYFFARTPCKYEYISIVSQLLPSSLHKKILRFVQPDRRVNDIFDTYYKMNTFSDIRKYFPLYKDQSYYYTSEPAYFFGSKYIFNVLSFFHSILPKLVVSNIYVILKKPSRANSYNQN